MDKRFMIAENAERAKKWKYLTEGLDNPRRLQTEVLLENMEQYLEYLKETSQISNVGAFTTFAFPMIRRIFPKLIAQTLVSVQPMSQPTGKIFFLDFKYGTAVGHVNEGDRVDQAGPLAHDYADRVEETGTVNDINFDISSVDVSAKEKALKAQWTLEAQQDLKAYHGLDAETELMAVLSDEIIREIDIEITADLLQYASAGNVNWNINAPASAPWTQIDPKIYKATLYDAMVDCNNLIFKKRYRNATWAMADADTCTRLEKLDGFKLTASGVDSYDIGIHEFGTVRNRWVLYKNPWFTANTILMGYKGTSWLDTGYVYCPYIPLYTTPLIIHPDTLKPIRGMMSRYAKKAVITDCYGTVTLVNS